MNLAEVEKHILKTGIVPILITYHKPNEEVDEYLYHLRKIHRDLAQLYWNALYPDDEDESKVLRDVILKSIIKTRKEYEFLLRYEKYALTHRFEKSVAFLCNLVTFLYEYEKAIGVMV